MSKRYYLSNIIGTGDEFDPFRPAVADLGVSWVGAIESGPDGRPIYPDCLVLVSTVNHAALRDDARIDPLPVFPLDGKLSAINSVVKSEMDSMLSRRGITITANSSDGYRDLVQSIGVQRSAAFNIDKFDVAG